MRGPCSCADDGRENRGEEECEVSSRQRQKSGVVLLMRVRKGEIEIFSALLVLHAKAESSKKEEEEIFSAAFAS